MRSPNPQSFPAPIAPAEAGGLDLGAPVRPADLLRSLLAAGRKDGTLREYRKDYRALARHLALEGEGLEERALEVLTQLGVAGANALVLAWRAEMEARGLAPATVGRRIAAVKTFTKLARQVGLIAWHLETPTPKADPIKDTRGPKATGIERLAEVLDSRKGRKGVRDRAILRVVVSLALRRAELCGLDLEDVDLAGRKLAILAKGKSGKEWLTLPEHAAAALGLWIAERGDWPGPLFTSMDRRGDGSGRFTADGFHAWCLKLGQAAGFPDNRPLRPHGLRHAAISECARATNGNAVSTQRFGRHKSANMTARYIDEYRDEFGSAAAKVDGAFWGNRDEGQRSSDQGEGS